jgi:hypothetical protein
MPNIPPPFSPVEGRPAYKDRQEVLNRAQELAHETIEYSDDSINETRADWGQAAVMTGCPDYAVSGEELWTDIHDALSNIAHFCERVGVNPKDVFTSAIKSYVGDHEDGPPTQLQDPSEF